MHDYHIPLTIRDEMSILDVINECHKDNWSPVIVIRYEDGRTVVPVFRTYDTAMKFIFRNFGGKKFKKTSGTIGMNKEHLELFTSKGWEVEVMDFPKKFTDRKDASLYVDAFEIPEGFHMPNQGVWE